MPKRPPLRPGPHWVPHWIPHWVSWGAIPLLVVLTLAPTNPASPTTGAGEVPPAVDPRADALAACAADGAGVVGARMPSYEPGAGEPVAVEDLERLANPGRSAAAYVGRPLTLEGELLGATVPGPGIVLETHALGSEGFHPAAAVVCNPGNGSFVTFVEPSRNARESTAHAGSADPCNQDGWNFSPHGRVTGHIDWWFNNDNGQSHIGDALFAALAKSGFDGMLTMRNDCGLSDNIDLTATRMGATVKAPGDFDGVNTMGWRSFGGDGRGYAIARHYGWSRGVERIEFDIAYNNDEANTRLSPSASDTCHASYHFGSVALHEVMHGYGFKHTSGNRQTMYASVAMCDDNMHTMGRGDWTGVNSAY